MYREYTNIKMFLESIFYEYENKYIFIYNLDIKLDYFYIDQIQFKQVFDNLILNSIKFSTNDLNILIKVYEINQDIIIEYHNSGIGFDDLQDLDNIFDIYTYGKSEKSGIGMGLYLCKKIILMHNGKIFAKKSLLLNGVMFLIILHK